MMKKFKLKTPRDPSAGQLDLTSTMMTQQEERMFYANKKLMAEQNNLQVNHRKGFKASQRHQSMENQEDDENIGPIEFSNLNQTSADQITDFINKLIAKNKVTSKNAFDIPLIHLQQMEDFRASLNQNTWKRLSSTLENDYKIYGYRVDAAHTITYKMVESIARHEATAEQTINTNHQTLPKSSQVKKHLNTDISTQLIDKSFNENVSRNRMNVDYTKFIEKNQKLLNVSHIEAYFSCNPGLQKTKRKFDQQGLKALLLNNIALRNGCELKLDEHRKYDLNSVDMAKKQPLQTEILPQNQFKSNNEADELFNKVFNQRNQYQMELQSTHDMRNIFEQIHELNVSDGQSSDDEFLKYERLYKIISGEDREEKRAQMKKRSQQKLQVPKQVTIQPQDDNTLIDAVVDPNLNLQDIAPQIENPSQKQNIARIQNPEESIPQNQTDQNPSLVSNNMLTKLNQNGEIKQSQIGFPNVQSLQSNLPEFDKGLRESNIIEEQPQNPIEQKIQNEQDSHVLRDKNFQMHQLNLDNLQDSSEKDSLQKSEYAGKFKNIQDYIKIKQPRAKNQRKPKIQMDQLTSEELEKKLFNRKYNKKKNDTNKDLASLKQENLYSQSKRKTNFSKITKQSADLKRSVVFKKSQTDERTFNLIKDKIRKKIQDPLKDKITQQEGEAQNKKKGKKDSRIFDLPIYQFERQDNNFINPFEQIDPDTNDLQFSSLYVENFPNFLQQSETISKDFKKKKLYKQKELQAKRKEAEEKQRQSQLQDQQHNSSLQKDNLPNQQNRELQNDEGSQQYAEPDISFIYDEMGHAQGRNQQVAIRDAKEKVRNIMLRMFKMMKSRKNKNGKVKKNKISFKQIYEAYYRQQGFISPALCFLTILHLANQHNLILEGRQDGTDFKIFVQEENKMCQFLQQETKEQNGIQAEVNKVKKSEMISEQIEQIEQNEEDKSGFKSSEQSRIIHIQEE